MIDNPYSVTRLNITHQNLRVMLLICSSASRFSSHCGMNQRWHRQDTRTWLKIIQPRISFHPLSCTRATYSSYSQSDQTRRYNIINPRIGVVTDSRYMCGPMDHQSRTQKIMTWCENIHDKHGSCAQWRYNRSMWSKGKIKKQKINWTCVGRGNANKEDKKAYPSVGKYHNNIRFD